MVTERKPRTTANRTSRAGQPRQSATRPKSPPEAEAGTKTGTSSPGPRKVRAGAKGTSALKKTTSHERATGKPASRLIDQRIRDLGGWRGETLARMRALILEAAPKITEEWKWMGTPVWSHHGNVCTGETYKQVVKLTFARGAGLPDPTRLFNSSLKGNTRRAIDIREGEQVDANAFKALVQAAVARNSPPAKITRPAAKATGTRATSTRANGANATGANAARPTKPRKRKHDAVVLLSGGNPQIAKADGDVPVQAYIAAMPGWKRDLGKRLDALIVRIVPDVRKAVKWNSPFYGIESQGWFLSFHVFTHYVKVTFFNGVSLRPIPPGGTGKEARWIDIHEGDPLDETQLTTWLKQAAALPGWITR